MTDLISREAALRVVNAYDYRGLTLADVKTVTDGCAKELSKLPAVDAVEVVRCKDCKHRGDAYGCPMYFVLWCGDDIDRTEDEGFCADGKRMDGEENG